MGRATVTVKELFRFWDAVQIPSIHLPIPQLLISGRIMTGAWRPSQARVHSRQETHRGEHASSTVTHRRIVFEHPTFIIEGTVRATHVVWDAVWILCSA